MVGESLCLLLMEYFSTTTPASLYSLKDGKANLMIKTATNIVTNDSLIIHITEIASAFFVFILAEKFSPPHKVEDCDLLSTKKTNNTNKEQTEAGINE